MSDVRTRFAPSPTGYLHIGGVRTALYNWLFSRRNGGAFILRIDDTDASRNVREALQPILDGFRWLGLEWDEGPEAGGDFGPYYQSQRLDRYRSAAEALVASGHAYRDYARPEELQAERDAAQQRKERFIYSRRFMAQTDAAARAFEGEGRSGVVRLKMPREGACRFTDRIRGDMEFEWAREQDHVIQRADGSCLYHLASVVDDHEMRISHVIRAEEHLSNTPRQIYIAEALGYALPEYAHLPYVAEPGSKNKLSKRKLDRYMKNADFAALAARGQGIADAVGLQTTPESFNPVIVGFYESMGFLPQAVLNYLLLLGWALDDHTEIFGREEMVEHFTLERVNRAPAAFDPAKLLAFQQRYMQALPEGERLTRVIPFVARAGLTADPPTAPERARVARVAAAAGERLQVAGDILDYREMFIDDADLQWEEKAFQKRLVKPEAAGLLRRYRDVVLEAAGDLAAVPLEEATRAFAEAEGVKIGLLVNAVRVAVTGKGVGFGLFETLEILGRESCLARLEGALKRLASV